MLPRQRVIAYSLLAHINDHDAGIRDLSSIFVPLIKKVLSDMSRRGLVGGKISDLKSGVDHSYGLDVPFPLLHSILLKVEAESELRGQLKVHGDRSFELRKFSLSGFEEVVEEQQEDIEYLDSIYDAYLRKLGKRPENEPSLYDFLDQRRIELSSHVANRTVIEDSTDYSDQAVFVSEVRGDGRAFRALRRVYLGSVIASYLEMDLSDGGPSKVELLLDTSFVVSLLGLKSVESKHTCTTIAKIAQRLGYRLTVLDLHIEETEALLMRQADSLSAAILESLLDPESIAHACQKRGMTKTGLQRIARGFAEDLARQYSIEIVEVTAEFRDEASQSTVYKRTVDRSHNPDGAPSDGIAFYYTQKKRGGVTTRFQSAKCWFVGNSAYKRRRRLFGENGQLNERVHADDLVSILWLMCPSALSMDVVDAGLTKLVAATLSRDLPEPQLLRELDEYIRNHATSEISPADLVAVASSSAIKTAGNLQGLKQAADESVEAFGAKVRALKREADAESASRKAVHRQERDEYEKALAEKDARMKGMEDTFERKKQDVSRGVIVESWTRELQQIEGVLLRAEPLVKSAERRALRLATLWSGCAVAVLVLIEGVCVWFWQRGGEAVIYVVNTTLFVALPAGYYFKMRRKLSPVEIFEGMVSRGTARSLGQSGFDAGYIEGQKKRAALLKIQLANADVK